MAGHSQRDSPGPAVLGRLSKILGLVVLFLIVAPAIPGGAEEPVVCEKRDKDGFCLIWVGGPGVPGPPGSGDPGGGGVGSRGYTGCASEPMPSPPPPPPGQPVNPGFGWYLTICYVDGVEVSRTPTYGSPAIDGSLQPIDPRVLAEQAIASMTMLPPPIQTMPPEGSEGAIVGVPVWMWVEAGVTTTGTNSASASAGGVTVTAVANVTEVSWEMGDGWTVICGIGTPYDGSGSPSPTCGHVYEVKSTKSDPNGVYTLTATSTWTIIWSGGGQSGTEVLELSSTGTLRVTEINVLNVPGGR